ncbi:hypothetical protein [Desmospora activa]|uniref:Holliday junction resolvase RusA-like endonuclease n=1 Tax=Desmospora activa DSM 45169 TaxID=1121389 RepID=A0A2T4Z908_9BACL|nr:hypothetical protein [Desmospora activa]PTM58360.1 Holliday junction resolvase RusA-like endonuclease [Desmospora activa DSM 45169]
MRGAVIQIEVPGIPPSLNQMRNMHYYKLNRVKREWARLISIVSAARRPSKPFERVVVTLTYHFPDKRRRDPDNYSGKFIMDALVDMGFLIDDSFDHVELRHRKGESDKHNPRVIITIEEEGAKTT